MIKFKDFYVSDSDYEEQMELFQNEHPNAEFIQITGGHMSPERIWFKYDDKLKEQPKLSIPKKIAEMLDQEIVADDITKFAMFHEGFERLWLSDDLTKYCMDYKNYALASAYLAGKALGVELVVVE